MTSLQFLTSFVSFVFPFFFFFFFFHDDHYDCIDYFLPLTLPLSESWIDLSDCPSSARTTKLSSSASSLVAVAAAVNTCVAPLELELDGSALLESGAEQCFKMENWIWKEEEGKDKATQESIEFLLVAWSVSSYHGLYRLYDRDSNGEHALAFPLAFEVEDKMAAGNDLTRRSSAIIAVARDLSQQSFPGGRPKQGGLAKRVGGVAEEHQRGFVPDGGLHAGSELREDGDGKKRDTSRIELNARHCIRGDMALDWLLPLCLTDMKKFAMFVSGPKIGGWLPTLGGSSMGWLASSVVRALQAGGGGQGRERGGGGGGGLDQSKHKHGNQKKKKKKRGKANAADESTHL